MKHNSQFSLQFAQRRKTACLLVLAALATLSIFTIAAAPRITGATGTFADGQIVTLTGSGFGVKSNAIQAVSAAPLIWDVTAQQFVGGTNRDAYRGLRDGDPINQQIWQYIQFPPSGEIARYSTSRSHRHARVAAHYTANGAKLTLGAPRHPDGSSVPPPTQKSFYLSFYRRLKFPCDKTNYCAKSLRVDSPNNSLVGTTYVGASGIFQVNSTGTRAAWIDEGTETNWVRWEMYVDVRKQYFDVWKNGHYHLGSWSGAGGTVEFRPATDWRFRTPGLPGYQFDAPALPANEPLWPALFGYDQGGAGQSPGQEIDVGEIYYDETLARVEISDQPVWDDSPTSRVQREVQGRLLSWSDGEITFVLYQGAFESLSNKFIYVIDRDGQANTNGFPVPVNPVKPVLKARMTNQASLLLSWPTNAAGFGLYSSSTLPRMAPWAAVTDVPVILNNEYQLAISITNRQQYFRLQKP
ncbi:MAG: hypothetical protein ACP5ON_11040 [Bacteroidota bacterium]